MVRALLDGDSDLVRLFALEHGDLQIFTDAIPFTKSLCFKGQLCSMWQFFWYIERPDIVGKPGRKNSLMAGCCQCIWSLLGFVVTLLSMHHLS